MFSRDRYWADPSSRATRPLAVAQISYVRLLLDDLAGGSSPGPLLRDPKSGADGFSRDALFPCLPHDVPNGDR